MSTQSPKRGAVPSPRSALAAAVPHIAEVSAPPNFIVNPRRSRCGATTCTATA
jgi:hypothetical protein